MRTLLLAVVLIAQPAFAGEADVAPDGTLLGRRLLLHPHETEQPFTRDLYGVKVPPGITHVTVRARHKPKGYDGATLRVAVPR
jgi:hypothetical protein